MTKNWTKGAVFALLFTMAATTVQAQSLGSILKGVKETVTEKVANTQAPNIVGKWKYVGIDCKLEGKDLLSKAGSVVAEQKIEEAADKWVGKLGFGTGSLCEFLNDGTYTITYKGKGTNGAYTYDMDKRIVNMKHSVVQIKPMISAIDHKKISLLMDAGVLLKISQTAMKVGKQLKNDPTIDVIQKLLEKYKGAKVGIQLERVSN